MLKAYHFWKAVWVISLILVVPIGIWFAASQGKSLWWVAFIPDLVSMIVAFSYIAFYRCPHCGELAQDPSSIFQVLFSTSCKNCGKEKVPSSL